MAKDTHQAHVCPECQTRLTRDNGVLRCELHGAFFLYGPQLLVRVPRTNGKASEKVLPWENRKELQREVQA